MILPCVSSMRCSSSTASLPHYLSPAVMLNQEPSSKAAYSAVPGVAWCSGLIPEQQCQVSSVKHKAVGWHNSITYSTAHSNRLRLTSPGGIFCCTSNLVTPQSHHRHSTTKHHSQAAMTPQSRYSHNTVTSQSHLNNTTVTPQSRKHHLLRSGEVEHGMDAGN